MVENNEIKREVLSKTAIEYYNGGIEELSKDRNNSSVVLFFKCLVSLIDLYILVKTGKTPSSHAERFRITKDKFPLIYNLIDKDFPFYQDSYNIIMSKELAEVIKEDAEKVSKELGISLS